VLGIADDGRVLKRHYIGESLHADARHTDGTILALGKHLHTIPRGQIAQTHRAAWPYAVACLSGAGQTPAAACSTAGRTIILLFGKRHD